MKCEEAFCIAGDPRAGGILNVSDHASNRVPDDIDLGIDPALLNEHVAIDIGVAGVAWRMVEQPGFAAFLANVSRLVCDCNRDENAPAVTPRSQWNSSMMGGNSSENEVRALTPIPIVTNVTAMITQP